MKSLATLLDIITGFILFFALLPLIIFYQWLYVTWQNKGGR